MDFKSASEKEGFKENLGKIGYAIFDFDGTIYPRLLLFDLAKRIFDQDKSSKIVKLDEIAKIYSQGKFEEAYKEFAVLLKGEDREHFQRVALELISNSYKYAGMTIKKLREKYGIKVYLISLTSDFIADVAISQLGIEKAFSVTYNYKKDTGKFSGNLSRKIESQQKMKEEMLSELKALEQRNNKFICFFDSSDDLPISKFADLRVGINPKPDLLKQANFNVILNAPVDPWKEFYEFI